MSEVTYKILIDKEEWNRSHIEKIEYERNLHILHQLKRHGAVIKDNGIVLSDDDIDYLTEKKAWEVSINTRTDYKNEIIIELYKESLAKSDAMWHELAFSQSKPMQVSRCYMEVNGITFNEYMAMIQTLQSNDQFLLASHPEHFIALITTDDDKLCGIEPFGMYGTPTLCEVRITDISELGAQIQADKDPEYTVDLAGRAYLVDGVTEINSPYHQFKAIENGFAVKMAVYWPENTPAEIVSGHSLHLATEFFEGLKLTGKLK